MLESRKNHSIWVDIKDKNWKILKYKLKILFTFYIFNIKIGFNINRYDRSFIINDSFIKLFNKKIGCKLFKHKWSTLEEERKFEIENGFHYCWKCSKFISDSEIRNKKLKNIGI